MYKKIVVPLDGSELAECVLPHVESIARGCGTEGVDFIRVVEPVTIPASTEYDGYTFAAQDWQRLEGELTAAAENYLSRLTGKLKYDGIDIQAKVVTGAKAADGIMDYADRNSADLIVIATHGRSGISRWVWGSVADRILRSTSVPILMIRAPGCEPGV